MTVEVISRSQRAAPLWGRWLSGPKRGRMLISGVIDPLTASALAERGLRYCRVRLSPSRSQSTLAFQRDVHLAKAFAQNVLQRWLTDHLEFVANPICGMVDVNQSP